MESGAALLSLRGLLGLSGGMCSTECHPVFSKYLKMLKGGKAKKGPCYFPFKDMKKLF